MSTRDMLVKLHKDHFTYKINLELNEDMACKRCGETIVPFDCSTCDVNPDIRYVDMRMFEQLVKGIAETQLKNRVIKRYTIKGL